MGTQPDIKKLRAQASKRAGRPLTQQALAHLAGKSMTTVRYAEAGAHSPSAIELAQAIERWEAEQRASR